MEKGYTFLKALLNRYHPQEKLSFLHFLPEKESLLVQGAWDVPQMLELNSFSWVNQIHYSWLIKEYEQYNSLEKAFLLKALSKNQKKGFLEFRETVPVQLRTFFSHFLSKKILVSNPEVKNPTTLPPSPMNVLLKLSKSQLTKLIQLLGIYDLAADLKSIINRELLEKVYAALSTEEHQFLHYCSRVSVKWLPPKLGLEAWNKDASILHKKLHQRGLNRLAKALANEDYSLQWHLCHRLDIGRGKAIEKLVHLKQDLSMAAYFKEQVLHIAKRFTPT